MQASQLAHESGGRPQQCISLPLLCSPLLSAPAEPLPASLEGPALVTVLLVRYGLARLVLPVSPGLGRILGAVTRAALLAAGAAAALPSADPHTAAMGSRAQPHRYISIYIKYNNYMNPIFSF